MSDNQMKSLTFLALRNLNQQRARTVLSALAVALGVAMIVAADATSRSILNSLAGSEDAQTIMTGLLDQLGSVLDLVGYGITFASGFLVFNAFGMSITQRRRHIGSLRILGMTRLQIMRLVLVEALIIGGLGVALGLAAGPMLSRTTIFLIQTLFMKGMFTFSASGPSIASLVIAMVLGLSITAISVLVPAWQATRITPLEALRQDATSDIQSDPSRRAWVGVSAILLLFSYLALAPPGKWVMPPWDVKLTLLCVLIWLVCLAMILPALIGGIGRGMRKWAPHVVGAKGRLFADNFQRGRGRVTLTILTLSIALMMVVATTGFFQFSFYSLMRVKIEEAALYGAWILAPFDFLGGMSAYSDRDALTFSQELLDEVEEILHGRAERIAWHFVIVPELSFFGSSYFSFLLDPHEARRGGDWVFTFVEGDWESAMPIMEDGCGILVMPMIAGNTGAKLGETLEVSGVAGPVNCTIAGIGSTYVGASIISTKAADLFGVEAPMALLLTPKSGVDRSSIEADLGALAKRHPEIQIATLAGMTELQTQVFDMLPNLFNALLILAIVVAALGAINTIMMSITERRRELSLLRAVGATQRQVNEVVLYEAALMGAVGGALGLIGGAGIIIILATVYGGNAWGVPDLDLWEAAWQAVRPGIMNGLVGLVVAPFICAGAALWPMRIILRGLTIASLQVE